MLLKFKDFLYEKKEIDLHIDMRNQLKYHIQTSLLKSYEIVNNLSAKSLTSIFPRMIKLTFFNDDIVELPLKFSDDGKYLVIDGKLWDHIVKYQELYKNSRDTENFYHEGEKYPFSKIHEIIEAGGSKWYNKLYEDFGLINKASVQETKNGTISLYYNKRDIAIGNYVPRDKPIFKITRSGNIQQMNQTQAFQTVRRMNCLEDYEKAFKLLYDIIFKRYMTALKKWEKENKNSDMSAPPNVEHAKKLKYPTLQGFVKIGLF